MTEAPTMRTCRKTACRWPAAASLSYRYDTRQVWLLDLADQPDPSLYDLCPHHADNLVVMRGWEQVDQRTRPEPVVEPAGRDLRPESGSPPVGPQGYGGNRYQALVDDLPKVAARLADEPAADELAESQQSADPAPPRDRGEVPVVPSRDLAPMPPFSPPSQAELELEVEEREQQAGSGEGVVVPFSLAGRHRGETD